MERHTVHLTNTAVDISVQISAVTGSIQLSTQFYTRMPELRQKLDETLFHSSRYNPHHVLRRLLPQPQDTIYKLRQRARNLTLPSDVSSTAKQSFIPRMLFAHFADYVLTYYLPNTCVCCTSHVFCVVIVTQVRLSFVH